MQLVFNNQPTNYGKSQLERMALANEWRINRTEYIGTIDRVGYGSGIGRPKRDPRLWE